MRFTSFHTHGSLSFVFGVSAKYLVTGTHKRLTADATSIDLSSRGGDDRSTRLLVLDQVERREQLSQQQPPAAPRCRHARAGRSWVLVLTTH